MYQTVSERETWINNQKTPKVQILQGKKINRKIIYC